MKINLGFLPLLTIIFVTLKLANLIDWSWWWVLSPLILGVILAAAMILFVLIVAAMVGGKRNGVEIPWRRG
jgi:hypothetical protein